MTGRYFTLLLSCLLSLAASAQQEGNTDVSQQSSAKDETKRSFVNNLNVNTILTKGGAFYVSNPPPLLEMDAEKAYLRTEWEPLVVRLMNGKTSELIGRYRIIDQKFEINVDGELYEIYSTMISGARLGEDDFVLLPDAEGSKIYQVHYRDDTYQLWSHHYTKWNDPPKQNMFDTSVAKSTLKRENDLLLITAAGKTEIKNKKDAIEALGLPKSGPALKFVKNKRLDLKKAEGLGELLAYLERSRQEQ